MLTITADATRPHGEVFPMQRFLLFLAAIYVAVSEQTLRERKS
jgi:hypothetical protein